MKEAGYVYILTNPSFKDDWVKIGKSSRPVDVRSNMAVPLPFEIYATVKTSKYEVLEKNLHKTIDCLSDLRIRQNREFFNISPAMALDLIRDIANLIDAAVHSDGSVNFILGQGRCAYDHTVGDVIVFARPCDLLCKFEVICIEFIKTVRKRNITGTNFSFFVLYDGIDGYGIVLDELIANRKHISWLLSRYTST